MCRVVFTQALHPDGSKMEIGKRVCAVEFGMGGWVDECRGGIRQGFTLTAYKSIKKNHIPLFIHQHALCFSHWLLFYTSSVMMENRTAAAAAAAVINRVSPSKFLSASTLLWVSGLHHRISETDRTGSLSKYAESSDQVECDMRGIILLPETVKGQACTQCCSPSSLYHPLTHTLCQAQTELSASYLQPSILHLILKSSCSYGKSSRMMSCLK